MRGEPAAAEAGVMLQQPKARRAFSRGSCPCITGPWRWRAAQATGRGGVESDLCSHTGFLVAAAAALASQCPSLGSALIAAAHARLWSSFKRRSESPLLAHQETKRQEKVSCLFGSSRLFPDSLPASCGALAPSGCVTPPTPVLSLRSDRSPSLSSQPRPPRRGSRQASRAGECCSVPSLCAGISPLCPPHPCGCALLHGSEASPLRHPQSPPAKGLPSVWTPFLLHSCLPLVQVLSLFFVSVVSFFFCPTQVRGGVSCLFGSLRSSASVQ